MAKQHGCSSGGRRRSKKHRHHRTRRGGMFASASGAVLGQGGQPAGMEFKGAIVSGPTSVTNTGAAAGQGGGRRRSRRSRKTRRSRRHRMRGGGGTGAGGDAGSRIVSGFSGPIGGTNWSIAGREAVYAGSPGTA